VSQVLDFVTQPLPPAAPSRAIDAAALHPQRTQAAAAAVQEAEALFAPSFDALRSEPLDLETPVEEDAEVVAAEPTLEPAPARPEAPEADGELEIESVGRAERADAKTVRVPLVVRDAGGRRLRVALSLRLDMAFTAGDE
jgi:hypothetical protein